MKNFEIEMLHKNGESTILKIPSQNLKTLIQDVLDADILDFTSMSGINLNEGEKENE